MDANQYYLLMFNSCCSICLAAHTAWKRFFDMVNVEVDALF
jgi:hypothetical protein